ncbi:hypothetical protein CEP53_008463 [Fusarium sp. AF-6]|nr:hypothetical protein CEP53_008463 [Fusarium sp. AF-6]
MVNEASMFLADDVVTSYSKSTGHDLPVQDLPLPPVHYAKLCFSRFGDRVKKWVTFNEPYITSIFAHHNGVLAPGRCAAAGNDTKTEPWRVGHTLILSHAEVVQMYSKEFASQKGDIFIVLNGHFYEPYSDSQADIDAAQRRLEFCIGWFGDPIFLGQDYPASTREYLGSRLPEFTPEECQLLRDTSRINAFYGMNHYSTKYAQGSINHAGVEIGPVSGTKWLRVAPEEFRKLLNWVWNRYQLPVIITENGCPCPGEDDVNVAVDDKFRTRYFGLYLDAISRAIYEDGVPVQGYYVWTLMDNFEWSAGFGPRFGITHVDFSTLKRTPKDSSRYLQETFRKRRSQKTNGKI